MSRSARLLLVALVAVLAVGGLQAPAQSATTWSYNAASGGTFVKLATGLVTSDLSSKSGIVGSKVPNADRNSVASVSALNLIQTGAVSTSNTAVAVTGGVKVRTTAQTAGINLLNGLIRADAVTSYITTVLKKDGTSTSTGNTQFLGLKIAGVRVPLDVPRNYTVGIQGVAVITLNWFNTGAKNGVRASNGWAIGVQLLKAQGSLPVGATITVNPEFQNHAPAVPTPGAKLGGQAYGTRILATVSDSTKIESPATAKLATPVGGSAGATIDNTTAGLSIPAVLNTGAVRSTSTSDRWGTLKLNADVVNTNAVAGVNLLGGLVTLDALKVRAHSRRQAGTCSGGLGFTVADLRIAGKAIPVTVAPNTTIKVGTIAKVVINERKKVGCAARIIGVHVTLLSAQAGLPAGATIEIGYASTQIS